MRRLVLSFVALVTVVAGMLLPSPSYAEEGGNVATPGDFTGYGFDQCNAPSQAAMEAWRKHSPFWAVGIYISGASRACREQPNLTPTWVATQLRRGWRLLPITLGPQASCSTRFPRYGNDPTINPKPGDKGRYGKARRQGRREAARAIEAARALGISAGSTLWYDLEGFDSTQTRCRESALAFLSGWTTRTRALGYVSGVYSSAGSGIMILDQARQRGRTDVTLPDRIWIARWDGLANTDTTYIAADGWRPGGRMKQYRGDHTETWGGVSINIDSNRLDLGQGSVAVPETHCNGVRVDRRNYPTLVPGTAYEGAVRALKCLLREQGAWTGGLGKAWNADLAAAVRGWQEARGLPVREAWSSAEWQTLLAAGTGPVLKFGSASPDVRRWQRALNAAAPKAVRTTGVYDRQTVAGVKAWQRRIGHSQTGIVLPKHWRRVARGRG